MTDPAEVFRSRHDEAARIASELREQGFEEAAAYVSGRADTWARAQAVLDGIRHGPDAAEQAAVAPDGGEKR